MPDLLANLNPSQVQAVTTTEGYVRVIAGAGTGKTRALTHRYAYLVNEYGISPSNILCITLTDFLRHITLLRDSDAEDTKDCVKIMTIHTAKGLEFDRVFLVGLTEGIFPSARSMEERVDEQTRTYYIRFVNGIRPISFDYQGLSHVF